MKALVTGAAGSSVLSTCEPSCPAACPGSEDVRVTAELTNKELTARLLEASGAGWEKVDYVTERKGHDRRYSLDTSKAHDELGYSPCISFDEGLASTIAWYHQNRSWWEPLKARAATT